MFVSESFVNMSVFEQHAFFLYAYFRHVLTVVPMLKQKSITCETPTVDIWQLHGEIWIICKIYLAGYSNS